jgi:hypothetical protein
MKRGFLAVAVGALLLTTGCRVQVDKAKDGGDKNVKIDTPMGGLHVRTDQMSAADVGLPVYPGAEIIKGTDNDKSADVHMGFGKWQLRVKVVNYQTQDSRDQVMAFYQKALGRYGDVIQCNQGNPVGTPTTTREGLTCGDNGKNVHVDEVDGLNLRAGSKHHQHLIEIKKGNGDQTKFALVELELPDTGDNSSESQ